MNHELIKEHPTPPPKLKDLHESSEDGVLFLRRKNTKPFRRVMYVNSYGMALAWRLWKEGIYPGNHLWGCLELALKGYEVLIPEPPSGRRLFKRLKNDWNPAWIAARHLKADDIIYCGHNILFWAPILKQIKAIRCKVTGLLFAREPLIFPKLYDGVIAHTPVAKKRMDKDYPGVLCSHISWGMDLDFFPCYPYDPQWALSSGKTFRDIDIITQALGGQGIKVTIIHPDKNILLNKPANFEFRSAKDLRPDIYLKLAHYYYRYSSVLLLTLMRDPDSRHSIGLTNLFESMASGRPAIVTRTSALTSEIDVEKEGVGLFVDPGDGISLRKAAWRLVDNPDEAKQMGQRGRELCEKYYNIDRFAQGLHQFFERL